MSALDQHRYLEGMGELSSHSEDWVSVNDLAAYVRARSPAANHELRTQLRLKNLWKTGHIVLSTDERDVALTPKGLSQLGKP
jgi:hypothetical protein